ncbi:hypothetical protein CVT26_010433 [Gymnopilus dilepis]|uniref:MYND-type domain-containing protein n=1 Tax=Gymnopilus dilepis TaxID=231916 RepID=A0A409Y0J4_9AGAR|nr:hypothetical protein CVT26_010433 [Gymnopilus dilepis]
MDAPRLLVCSCPTCNNVLPHPPKRCMACKARAYCNKTCQKADWSVHRLYCKPRSTLTDHDKTAFAYDAKHRNLLVTVAYNLYEFDKLHLHLQGKDRLQFLAIAKTSFIHIKLQRVLDPPPRRENRVAFLDPRVADVTSLAKGQMSGAFDRVERRFPAFCFGYSIVDADGSYTAISSVTHPFSWPALNSPKPLKLQKTLNLVQLFERMWVLEALEEQEGRERKRFALLNPLNACGTCWMMTKGRKMAGEEVEDKWHQFLA